MLWTRVGGCCCCCSLKTGTILVGVFQVLTGFFMMLGEYAAKRGHSRPTIQLEPTRAVELKENELYIDIRAMSIITVVIGTVQMFLGYLLISGADKGKHNQIKLWIIVTIITGVVFSLVVSLYMVLVSLMLTGSTGLFAVFLLLALPVLAVAYYSLLVVHSYYKTLLDALENSDDDSIEMSRF